MCVSTEAVIDTKSWLTIQLCDEEDGTEEETTEEDPKKKGVGKRCTQPQESQDREETGHAELSTLAPTRKQSPALTALTRGSTVLPQSQK